MLFALLIYENPSDFERRDPSIEKGVYVGAWRKYYQAMVEAGIHVGGEPLDVPETATTVRWRDSKRLIQDGPFAGTKEQLGGYCILDCEDLDTALRYAAMIPSAKYGSVEVRPVMVMGPH